MIPSHVLQTSTTPTPFLSSPPLLSSPPRSKPGSVLGWRPGTLRQRRAAAAPARAAPAQPLSGRLRNFELGTVRSARPGRRGPGRHR
eukprot:348007-Hanusia_phi.AAC.1